MQPLLKHLGQPKRMAHNWQKKKANRIGIKGCGFSVPPHIRNNDDPIFHQVITAVNAQGIAEKDLFTGMKERRYLTQGERLEPLMVEASRLALKQVVLQKFLSPSK